MRFPAWPSVLGKGKSPGEEDQQEDEEHLKPHRYLEIVRYCGRHQFGEGHRCLAHQSVWMAAVAVRASATARAGSPLNSTSTTTFALRTRTLVIAPFVHV